MSQSDMSGPLVIDEGILSTDFETITTDTAISIKSGVVTLDADLCVTLNVVTLPDPTAGLQENGGDDGKRLRIVDIAGLAHTVTPTTPFGNGGAGEDVATFSGTKGDVISLIAYNGYWFITGKHQVTVA